MFGCQKSATASDTAPSLAIKPCVCNQTVMVGFMNEKERCSPEPPPIGFWFPSALKDLNVLFRAESISVAARIQLSCIHGYCLDIDTVSHELYIRLYFLCSLPIAR
jgi:hypothetical protein